MLINSDSKECTESKLSRVYSALTPIQPTCTLRAHCPQAAHTALAGRCVVAHKASCRKPCPVVSWSCCRPCPALSWSCCYAHTLAGASCRGVGAFAPSHDTKIVSRLNPCRARIARRVTCAPDRIRSRVAAHCCHVAALYRSPTAPYCDTIVAPQPRYNFCIATPQPARPHALARAAARPWAQPTVSWPRLAVSWRTVGLIVALLLRA